jgi:hypothetical protein
MRACEDTSRYVQVPVTDKEAARWSSGLRHWPLTPVTAVRICYGSPKEDKSAVNSRGNILAGANDDEVPPVPIPNTEVKLISAKNTWRETARENRSVPA